ncbi:MAG: DUF1206 domain-containing protein [Pirellulales bacterium]
MSNSPFEQTQPYSNPNSQSFGIDQPAKSGFPWGCLLGGCLGIMLLGLIAAGGVGYGLWSLYKGQIAKYTSDKPVEIPTIEASEEQVKAIKKRFDDFGTEFEAGEAPQELVITADEINTLISGDPELKGHVYVKIEDGNIQADVSFSLGDLPGAKGRYFNGSVTLHVEIENGEVVANVVDAEVNGQPVPDEVLGPFSKENLAKEMRNDPEMAKTLERCESLEVKDDKIILKIRPKPSTKSNKPQTESGSEAASTEQPSENKPNEN